ncbi:MAG: hypothetical protein ACOYJS_01680 [Acutalibacteraceae bacterium]
MYENLNLHGKTAPGSKAKVIALCSDGTNDGGGDVGALPGVCPGGVKGGLTGLGGN